MILSLSRSKSCLILIAGDEGTLLLPFGIEETSDIIYDERTIAHFLQKYSDTPIKIFADIPGQNFYLEPLPRLNPFDRSKLLRRRLQQHFPSAAAAAWHVVGNTEVILVGLPKESPASRWLESANAQNRDIGLLSIECADLALRLMPEAAKGWILLVARTRTGGFRQIVLRAGVIVFSRLGSNMDIQTSLGYLMRFGLKDSRALHVLVLSPNGTREDFNLPVNSITVMSPAKAVQRLALTIKLKRDEEYSDALFAAWLVGQKKIKLSLLPPEMCSLQQTERIRFYGQRIAAAALVFIFGIILWQMMALATAWIGNYRQSVTLNNIQQQIMREETAATRMTGSLGRFRAALERNRIFAKPVLMPWTILTQMDQALVNTAKLVKLDWRSGDARVGETLLVDVRLIGVSSPPDETALVEGFRKLARQIKAAEPYYTVDVVHYPIPVLPQEALTKSDDVSDRTLNSMTAQIMLRKTAP